MQSAASYKKSREDELDEIVGSWLQSFALERQRLERSQCITSAVVAQCRRLLSLLSQQMLVAQASKSLHDADAMTIKTLKNALKQKEQHLQVARQRELVAQRLVARLQRKLAEVDTETVKVDSLASQLVVEERRSLSRRRQASSSPPAGGLAGSGIAYANKSASNIRKSSPTTSSWRATVTGRRGSETTGGIMLREAETQRKRALDGIGIGGAPSPLMQAGSRHARREHHSRDHEAALIDPHGLPSSAASGEHRPGTGDHASRPAASRAGYTRPSSAAVPPHVRTRGGGTSGRSFAGPLAMALAESKAAAEAEAGAVSGASRGGTH